MVFCGFVAWEMKRFKLLHFSKPQPVALSEENHLRIQLPGAHLKGPALYQKHRLAKELNF